MKTPNPKPPVGVAPKSVWMENKLKKALEKFNQDQRCERIYALTEAIQRYATAGLEWPVEWMEELAELNQYKPSSDSVICMHTQDTKVMPFGDIQRTEPLPHSSSISLSFSKNHGGVRVVQTMSYDDRVKAYTDVLKRVLKQTIDGPDGDKPFYYYNPERDMFFKSPVELDKDIVTALKHSEFPMWNEAIVVDPADISVFMSMVDEMRHSAEMRREKYVHPKELVKGNLSAVTPLYPIREYDEKWITYTDERVAYKPLGQVKPEHLDECISPLVDAIMNPKRFTCVD